VRDLSGKDEEAGSLSSTLTVERRWLSSVIVSIVLSAVVIVITVYHMVHQFAAMSPTMYVAVLVCSAVIFALSFIAFIDYFAVELHVKVQRQVSISKKELMERKRRAQSLRVDDHGGD
jgi:hypothetical protein